MILQGTRPRMMRARAAARRRVRPKGKRPVVTTMMRRLMRIAPQADQRQETPRASMRMIVIRLIRTCRTCRQPNDQRTRGFRIVGWKAGRRDKLLIPSQFLLQIRTFTFRSEYESGFQYRRPGTNATVCVAQVRATARRRGTLRDVLGCAATRS